MARRYKLYFQNKTFLGSFAVALVLLFMSFVINFYAGTYATEKASNAVTDLILNNIPVFDVDVFFVYGAGLFWVFVIFLCLARPQRIPFTLKSVSLFILTRSLFITLTHIGPFPTRIPIPISGIVSKFAFGGDLFFSGHTGLPFLLALIFWDAAPLRFLFIAASLFFGTIVILGHLHYSIDVLSAFFITYTIYRLAELLFKKDRILFRNGLE